MAEGTKFLIGKRHPMGSSVLGENVTIALKNKRFMITQTVRHTIPSNILLEKPQPGTWQLWQHQLELKSDTTELIVRAWDSLGNTQPPNLDRVWNFKGYMNNAWHRIRIDRKITSS